MAETREGLLERFPALRNLRSGRRQRQIPFVQQTAATDCGAACVAMVLGYWGKPTRLDEVRQVAASSRAGADAYRLLQAGRWFRLSGRGVQVPEAEDLSFLPRGAILHWNFSHFVVFEKLTSDGAIIVDPAMGRRRIGLDELRRSFTGVAVIFEPGEGFEPGEKPASGIGRYIRELLARTDLLGRILTLSVLLQVFGLATPVLMGLIVDRVVPRGDEHLLTILSAGLGGIVVFNLMSSLIRAHLLVSLRTQFDARITLQFFEHLIELPFKFFQQRSSGDLMMRLNSHATIRETLTSGALSGLLDGTIVSLYLVVLFVAHWKMGLLALGLGLLRLSLFLLTRRRQRDLMSQSLQTQANSRGFQVQMFNGVETLKAAGAEQRAMDMWSSLFVDELNVSLARGRLNAVFDSLLSTLGMASPMVVLTFGAWMVLDGQLSLGTMLALNALALGFLQPLSALIDLAVQLQLLGSYLERIDDVMETPKEQDIEEVQPAPKIRGRITLEDVSFRYAPVLPMVVRDVSLDIEPGRFVALVGPSGAGKTTLANLLLGLYQPTTGRILYDGIDLSSVDLRSLRSQLGIVTQQPYLFGGSIRSNISLPDPSIPMPRILEAARKAKIHEDIAAMPMGYDTILSDGGGSLSVGQRQRLALARALVTQPSILLLDEATSNLDAMAESEIQKELGRLQATRIVIAHRLSTVRAADLILVMHAGRIVERGTHDELLARQGLYSRLVASQLAQKPMTAGTPR